MATEKYIPTGRTSLVKNETGPLQLQTEYTYRPYPRITTTILNSGQVLHKIETRLEREVDSAEELARMEEVIRRQHSEVEEIVMQGSLPGADTEQNETGATDSEPTEQPKGIKDTLREVPGVEYVFRMTNEGEFLGQTTSQQFKKDFAPIFKGIHDLLGIFDELPGPGIRRKRGVYEVERDRLYLISMGDECLFVTVCRSDRDTDFEQELKKAAFGDWGPDFVDG